MESTINRSKYYIDPKDPDRFVTVEVFVDWSGDEPRILNSVCDYSQGDSPCKGNPLIPCNNNYEKCNHYNKSICTDELGKLKFYAKEQEKIDGINPGLPKSIVKEWAKFERRTYGARSYIDSQSYRIDHTTQNRVYDSFRNRQYTIKALLKSWSLGDIDPDLVLQPIQMEGVPFTTISNDQMRIINRVDDALLESFIKGYEKKIGIR